MYVCMWQVGIRRCDSVSLRSLWYRHHYHSQVPPWPARGDDLLPQGRKRSQQERRANLVWPWRKDTVLGRHTYKHTYIHTGNSHNIHTYYSFIWAPVCMNQYLNEEEIFLNNRQDKLLRVSRIPRRSPQPYHCSIGNGTKADGNSWVQSISTASMYSMRVWTIAICQRHELYVCMRCIYGKLIMLKTVSFYMTSIPVHHHT